MGIPTNYKGAKPEPAFDARMCPQLLRGGREITVNRRQAASQPVTPFWCTADFIHSQGILHRGSFDQSNATPPFEGTYYLNFQRHAG